MMTQIAEAVTAAIDRANEWPEDAGTQCWLPGFCGSGYRGSTKEERLKYG